MSTLATYRQNISQELADTTNASFTIADVDRALARAVDEYSRYNPIRKTTTQPTTNASHELTIDPLNYQRLMTIERAEYPTGQTPPAYCDIEPIDETTIYLHTETTPNGSNCRVYWLQTHLVDASASTIPPHHETIVVQGAVAHCLLIHATRLANAINADPRAHDHYRTLANEHMSRYLADLKRLNRRLRSSTLRAVP
jgi:hypothetical protein